MVQLYAQITSDTISEHLVHNTFFLSDGHAFSHPPSWMLLHHHCLISLIKHVWYLLRLDPWQLSPNYSNSAT